MNTSWNGYNFRLERMEECVCSKIDWKEPRVLVGGKMIGSQTNNNSVTLIGDPKTSVGYPRWIIRVTNEGRPNLDWL